MLKEHIAVEFVVVSGVLLMVKLKIYALLAELLGDIQVVELGIALAENNHNFLDGPQVGNIQ